MAKMEWSGNMRTAPVWLANFLDPNDMVRTAPAKLDVTQFTNQLGVDVLVGSAGAAANATSVPVAALTGPSPWVSNILSTGGVVIRANSTVIFGSPSAKKIAVLSADAKIGDTALTTYAIPTALVSGDDARYQWSGAIYVPAGTVIGRTLTERNAGTGYGPGDVTTPDGELGLLLFDCADIRYNNDCEVLRPTKSTSLKENYLPGWTGLAGAVQAWIRANYDCVTGLN